jgi:hypothetical protein
MGICREGIQLRQYSIKWTHYNSQWELFTKSIFLCIPSGSNECDRERCDARSDENPRTDIGELVAALYPYDFVSVMG